MTPLMIAICALCGVALLGLGIALGLWLAHNATMEALRNMKL